jgi:hypothetical protein
MNSSNLILLNPFPSKEVLLQKPQLDSFNRQKPRLSKKLIKSMKSWSSLRKNWSHKTQNKSLKFITSKKSNLNALPKPSNSLTSQKTSQSSKRKILKPKIWLKLKSKKKKNLSQIALKRWKEFLSKLKIKRISTNLKSNKHWKTLAFQKWYTKATKFSMKFKQLRKKLNLNAFNSSILTLKKFRKILLQAIKMPKIQKLKTTFLMTPKIVLREK